MATPFGCKCPERRKPVKQRKWVVITRNCNYSAFNGYRRTFSEYSLVYCPECQALGRTKAAYVDQLKDGEL